MKTIIALLALMGLAAGQAGRGGTDDNQMNNDRRNTPSAPKRSTEPLARK